MLGLHVVAPNGGDIVQGLSLGLRLGATVDDLAAMHHVFPTFAEGVKAAAEQAMPQPVEMAAICKGGTRNSSTCRGPGGLDPNCLRDDRGAEDDSRIAEDRRPHQHVVGAGPELQTSRQGTLSFTVRAW